MAIYEYLCTKCRNEFELMRPIGEAEKPARCPRCGSEAQKLMSGLGSKTGDSIQPAGEPFSKRTDVVGEMGLESSHVERRDMAQKSLLQQLAEVASKIRLLEREKSDAVARIRALELEKKEAVATGKALEREVGELVSLVTLAGEKVEEILKAGANDEISQPQAVDVPAESKSLGQMGEFSADPQKQLKRLSSKAWRFD
jgi:putative FmdB family regulatory protein